MGVPVLTSFVKSAFSGESGSKNGPSVWASVAAPLPHAGVGARVVGEPPAAPRVLRGRRLGRSPPPELQAARTAGMPSARPPTINPRRAANECSKGSTVPPRYYSGSTRGAPPRGAKDGGR